MTYHHLYVFEKDTYGVQMVRMWLGSQSLILEYLSRNWELFSAG